MPEPQPTDRIVERDDQRAGDRIAVRFTVRYRTVDGFLQDYAANISVGGLFVESPNPCPTGTEVEIRFELPERELPVETTGVVRWVTDGPLKRGMGIQFVDLDPADKEAVQAWLENW